MKRCELWSGFLSLAAKRGALPLIYCRRLELWRRSRFPVGFLEELQTGSGGQAGSEVRRMKSRSLSTAEESVARVTSFLIYKRQHSGGLWVSR